MRYSVSFVVPLLLLETVSANTIWLPFSKPLLQNSTDDYLLQLSLGSGSSQQKVYLNPSIGTDDTFVISPKACTPPGNTSVWTGCVNYRGGVYSVSKSSSYSSVNEELSWRDVDYNLFATGSMGRETITFTDNSTAGSSWEFNDFEFGVADACNMTSGFIGLGRNSTLLSRLVSEGKIFSRSFGLHVGVDIEDHEYPIFDPTFDSGERPYSESDYNSGFGKRKRQNSDNWPVHAFPGSLTFGGYDKAKIDNRTVPLKANITGDGKLELELVELVVRNKWMVNEGVHDVFNGTRKAVIDTNTPYIYLPSESTGALVYAIEAYYGSEIDEYWYSRDGSQDQYIGNLSFTLRAPGSNDNITIVVPPSALYKPITRLRDYVPVGGDDFDYMLPVKGFRDGSQQPIVLGRTFLKAAYLFVNHDQNTFQISQAAYVSDTKDLITVGADTDSATGSNSNSSSATRSQSSGPPIAIIAAAAGGAVVIIGAAVFFFLWRRRRPSKKPSSTTSSNVSLVNLPPQLPNNEKPLPAQLAGSEKPPPTQLPGGDGPPVYIPPVSPHPAVPQTAHSNASWGDWGAPKPGETYYYPQGNYHEMDNHSPVVMASTSNTQVPQHFYPPPPPHLRQGFHPVPPSPITPITPHPGQQQYWQQYQLQPQSGLAPQQYNPQDYVVPGRYEMS